MISCTKLVPNLYLGTRRSNVPIWYLDVRPCFWVLFSFQNWVPSSMLSISPVPSSLTNGQQYSGIQWCKNRASAGGQVVTQLNYKVTTSRLFKNDTTTTNITNYCTVHNACPCPLHIQQNLLLRDYFLSSYTSLSS